MKIGKRKSQLGRSSDFQCIVGGIEFRAEYLAKEKFPKKTRLNMKAKKIQKDQWFKCFNKMRPLFDIRSHFEIFKKYCRGISKFQIKPFGRSNDTLVEQRIVGASNRPAVSLQRSELWVALLLRSRGAFFECKERVQAESSSTSVILHLGHLGGEFS